MSLPTIALILLAFLALVSIPLVFLGAPGHYGTIPFGLRDPVLALELIQNEQQVDDLVCAGTDKEPANRKRLRRHTYIDMAFFIPGYFLFFLCLALLAAADFSLMARLAIFLILSAAIADYVEDAGILSALSDGDRLHWTRPASLVKWGCFFAAAAALSPWWLTRLNWIDKLGGLALAVAGLWGIGAAATANERHIGMALNPVLVAGLAIAWRLWRLRGA